MSNAVRVGNSTSYGSTLTYTCTQGTVFPDTGYGTRGLECSDSGAWNDTMIGCESKAAILYILFDYVLCIVATDNKKNKELKIVS